MQIKGLDQLRKHLPDLATRGGTLRLFFWFAFWLAATTAFFIWVDSVIADWMPDGEIVLLTLGLLVVALFFRQKSAYQQRYGEGAYRRAFLRFCIPGIGILGASIAHLAYMPGVPLPPIWWTPVLIALGVLFILVGALLWMRSLLVLGADNLALLYVYYPGEGTRIEAGIYRILRHPVYAAVLNIAMGLALMHANWYALLVAVLLPLGFTGWTRFVEEKDLIERFPAYADYRQQVPAFFIKPGDAGRFIGFLLSGR
jgi:protein-S-isoprenylcysteine O-methyltransferase Ste14